MRVIGEHRVSLDFVFFESEACDDNLAVTFDQGVVHESGWSGRVTW